MSSSFDTSHRIHIHNAPVMHRHGVYPPPQTYIRSHNPYQLSYSPPYYPYPPGFDPSVSLAHPYIYDPTHIKHRRRTTPEQLKILEDTFKTDPKPNPTLRKQLSVQLGMSPRVLQVWFQNRRMKVKRLAKKQSVAEQRAASPDSEARDQDHPADPSTSPAESPSKSPSSLPSGAPTPADSSSSSDASPPADEASPPAAAAARPEPLPELGVRRGSLPVPTTPFSFDPAEHVPGGGSGGFEGVADPAFRRRSFTSLHRLESHPFAPLVAASNGIQQRTPDQQHPTFPPIVPPSLPPTFRPPRLAGSGSATYHHHSPSTPAPRPGINVLPQTSRAASFHVIPNEHRFHAFPQHQPYAFPPRPLPAPGPGPLPAPDYSFGTSTAPCPDETQEEFDVRPYVPSVSTAPYSVRATAAAAAGFPFPVPRLVRQDDDTDASTSYTGYSSRFGSIASVAESDASGRSVCGRAPSVSSASGSVGAWDGGDRWAEEEGRRGSWTGQVAEMLSGLDVRGDAGKSEETQYEGAWEVLPSLDPYACSSSQESLGVYVHPPSTAKDDRGAPALSYCSAEDGTPPAGPPPPQYAASRFSISQSSELAFALCGMQQESGKQQTYSPSTQAQGQHGQSGEEMLEMHHALAGFAEHSSIDGLSTSYSIGNFVAPGQDGAGETIYNMY